MLNSYGVGGTDLDSKLRSDVLVGEQGSSEETGLMAPSVELDQLQVCTVAVCVLYSDCTAIIYNKNYIKI